MNQTILQKHGLLLGLVAFLCLILQGCFENTETPYPEVAGNSDYPVLELRDSVVLDMWEGNHLSWILKTGYLRKMMRSEKFTAKPVEATLFDTLGRKSGLVVADSGSADESATYMYVWGHVHISADHGAKVWADSLYWESHGRTISSDGYVKVVSLEGDTLTGVGFRSDDELKNWKILSRVRGVIQRVEKRESVDVWKVPGPEDGL